MPAGGGKPGAPGPRALGPVLRVIFWCNFALLGAIVAAWIYFTPPARLVEEYYTRGIYRLIVGLLTPLTQLIPFSVALVIVSAALLFVLVGFPLGWLGQFRRYLRGGASLSWALLWGPVRLVQWGVAGAVLVMAWFYLFWGAGYQRVPAEERLALDTAAITDAEAATLASKALEVIRRDTPLPDQRDVNRAIAAISRAMRAWVEEQEGRPIVLPDRVKSTPPGLLMMNGSSGICAPITVEPNVDGGLPDTAFVYVAAHELGHVAGACKEDEATLYGYIAGLRADDSYARYCVALDIYTDLVARLPKEQREAAMEQLPVEAIEDLKASRAAYAKYRIDWLRKANRAVYTQYLQAQGIAEGMKNYSRGITLFAWAWRKGLVRFPEYPRAA